MTKRTRKRCATCGCAEDDPCHVHGVTCCWIETDGPDPVCSACAGLLDILADPTGREWLDFVLDAAVTGKYESYEPCLASVRYELTEACHDD